jgi:protein-disulfide isomerase
MLLCKRKGHIYFAFRNFPLREKHPHAQISAEAALSAGKQGYFWLMHDLLYQNWSELNKQKIEGIANQIDLDMNQFQNDLKQRTLRDRVAIELKEGITHDVEGTPTFFINEEMYNGALNYKELEHAIDNLF